MSPNDLNNELNKELKLLTEQYRVIDANEDNKLILVDGYAGSGKTVLALELARRKVLEGKMYYSYFNRLIKNHIEDQIGLINVKKDINNKKISIFTLYEFVSVLFQKNINHCLQNY